MEIEKNKLIVAASLVGVLGIMITIFSTYHTRHMGTVSMQYPLFLYGVALISLVLGGYIVYLFEGNMVLTQTKKLLRILPHDERKVMKILLDRTEIEQRKLGTLSGLSAVKMSRILTALEQRGIIEKKKHGYTNLIILTMT